LIWAIFSTNSSGHPASQVQKASAGMSKSELGPLSGKGQQLNKYKQSGFCRFLFSP
jgi:hypothetical protein